MIYCYLLTVYGYNRAKDLLTELIYGEYGEYGEYMEKVERIQYQSALAISGTWHGSSRSNSTRNWDGNLSDRRMGRRILQIHKILSNSTPCYLNDKLPPKCRALFSGKTRNTFRQIICKSNRYMIVFSLMQFLPGSSLLNTLRFHLLIFLKIILILFSSNGQKYFWYTRHCGLRYLFQLRVSLSPLKSHKFRHNFADTLLRYVVAAKASKIRIISYSIVLTMHLPEQP